MSERTQDDSPDHHPESGMIRSGEHGLTAPEAPLIIPEAFESAEQLQDCGRRLTEARNRVADLRNIENLFDGDSRRENHVVLVISEDRKDIKIHIGGGFYTPIRATPEAVEEAIAHDLHMAETLEKELRARATFLLERNEIISRDKDEMHIADSPTVRASLEVNDIAYEAGSKGDLILRGNAIEQYIPAARLNMQILESTAYTHATGEIRVTISSLDKTRLHNALKAHGIQFTPAEKGVAAIVTDHDSICHYIDLQQNNRRLDHKTQMTMRAAVTPYADEYRKAVSDFDTEAFNPHLYGAEAAVYEFKKGKDADAFAKGLSADHTAETIKPRMWGSSHVIVKAADGKKLYNLHYIDGSKPPEGVVNSYLTNETDPKRAIAEGAKKPNRYEQNAKIETLRTQIRTLEASINEYHDERRAAPATQWSLGESSHPSRLEAMEARPDPTREIT